MRSGPKGTSGSTRYRRQPAFSAVRREQPGGAADWNWLNVEVFFVLTPLTCPDYSKPLFPWKSAFSVRRGVGYDNWL